MAPTQLLVKAITLLYRESQIEDSTDNSSDLVLTVIEALKLEERAPELVIYNNSIHKLKNIVMDMVNSPSDSEYDKSTLLQDIKIATLEDEKLHIIIKENLDKDLEQKELKKTTTILKRTLTNYYKEIRVGELLSSSAYEWRHKPHSVRKSNEFIETLISKLEEINLSSNSSDPAVIAELDVGDTKKMTEMFDAIKDNEDSSGIFKTGFHGLNDMLQGGFRRGEFVTVGALQHNYKTGMTLTLFKHLAVYNKPYMTDATKKPVLVRISFEDEITSNLKFLYMNLKYEEDRKYVETKNVSSVEMAEYIKEKLSVNGYHIKLLRVDPTSWSFKDIFNYILDLESKGYEVHALLLDYLAMIPLTGCDISGPSGTGLRDLFRRMRNFCAGKKILCITPHQLSTDAKGLIRNGVPPERFLKEIEGKGYYERSKQLDQEVDCELYVHIVKHNRKSYLAIQRGKHRLPTMLEDEDMKFMMMQFPKRMPIPDDVNGEPTHIRKLPMSESSVGETESDLFSM